MAQSFITHFKHDVFLSFYGRDTRYNLAGNLYNTFRKRGINIFLDDQNLRVGDELSSSLLKAIELSRISIVVFSKNYAFSTWCLDELVKILKCNEQNKQLVYPIFYKVDPSDIRHQKDNYDRAMAAHEARFGKDSEKVLTWRSALTKAANLKGHPFKTGYEYEYDFIDRIFKKVSSRLPSKGLHVGKYVVGLESRLEKVISLLDIPSHSTVCMLEIYGIGGIGKTTLAKALYNSIVHQFEYAIFLSDIRETSKQFKGLESLQRAILSMMLEEEDVKLSSVDEGAFKMKNSLCNSRVLLVLDDVDRKEQLEKLAGDCNWFGSGSRIIVTTRYKNLLPARLVKKKYEMEELKYHEAFELFCWKAFESSQPRQGYEHLSNEVVNYASGLPLALEVMGSHLVDKNLDACVCALDQYKRIPHPDIQRILRISYDALEDYQKEIFLDIACFFKGCHLEYVENTLDACGFFPKYNIRVLIDKSLIDVDKWDHIQMHDLIQDMGRAIVREEAPKEPGRRSRLWFDEDIIKVLQENSGTCQIEGIMLDSNHQTIKWNRAAFKKMKNLRILIIRDIYFSEDPKYLPNNLRVLEWEQCPSTSFPSSFDLRKLVILKMPRNRLKLEKSFEKFKNVNEIDFSFCQFLIELPDMSGCSSLRRLRLFACKNLVKVHDSFGFLNKVTLVDLRYCKNLRSLPNAMQMTSLEVLYIDNCTSFEHFPNILRGMDRLRIIHVRNTAIKEFNLTGLSKLELAYGNLISLPTSTKELSNLVVRVYGCKKLQEIYGLPPNSWVNAEGCTSLTLQSQSTLLWQAIKMERCENIRIPGTQIPDWFDHRCEGGVLSFWARRNGKLPDGVFAFIGSMQHTSVRLRSFFNGVEVKCQGWLSSLLEGCHIYVGDLFWFWETEEGVERYLIHEWNHIEIKLTISETRGHARDWTISQCGLYVREEAKECLEDIRFECPKEAKECLEYILCFKDIRFECSNVVKECLEDMQFECPYCTMFTGVLPRNVSKRGTFHPDNEPPKKRSRNRGKFHIPSTQITGFVPRNVSKRGTFHPDNLPPKKRSRNRQESCEFTKWLNRIETYDYLYLKHPVEYRLWVWHRKCDKGECCSAFCQNRCLKHPLEDLINDVFGFNNMHSDYEANLFDDDIGNNDMQKQTREKIVAKFYRLLNNGNQKFYMNYIKLSILIKLHHITCLCGMIDMTLLKVAYFRFMGVYILSHLSS